MLKYEIWFIFFLIPFFLFSAPVGNPALPSILEEGFMIPDKKIINLRAGYQIYYSQDLILKFSDSAKDDFYFRKMKAFGNFGLLILNIKERLDFYAELGSYKIEPQFKYKSDLYCSKSENNLLSRLGAKLVLIEIGDFALGIDAKYCFFNAGSSFITKNDKPLLGHFHYDMREWQIGVGVGQKIVILRPYLGIVYRDTKVQMDSNGLFEKLNLVYKKKAGLFLGCSASLGSYVLLNGEIRLVNERSTSISAELRF